MAILTFHLPSFGELKDLAVNFSHMCLFSRPIFLLVTLLVGTTLSYGQGQATTLTNAQVVLAAQRNSVPDYVLGSDDTVSILVMNHTELSGSFLIASDGNVQLPGVGKVRASGLTLSQLSQAYAQLLKSNMSVGLLNPVVTTSLIETHSNKIYVIGDVKIPGVFDIKPGWRITEALAVAGGLFTIAAPIAGGFAPQMSDFSATVIHAAGGAEPPVSVADAAKGLPGKNYLLRPGDSITFKQADLTTVYVSGLVAKPGLVQMRSDQATVLNSISIGGGLVTNASLRYVTVRHTSGLTDSIDLVGEGRDHIGSANPMLQAGDLVTVPENPDKIAVLGLVLKPGMVYLPEAKEFHLSDALGNAGGFDKRARLGKVAVLTTAGGKVTRKVYDYVAFLSKGDRTMNPVLHPGEVVMVPETNTPDWTAILGFGSWANIIFGPQGLAR